MGQLHPNHGGQVRYKLRSTIDITVRDCIKHSIPLIRLHLLQSTSDKIFIHSVKLCQTQVVDTRSYPLIDLFKFTPSINPVVQLSIDVSKMCGDVLRTNFIIYSTAVCRALPSKFSDLLKDVTATPLATPAGNLLF